MADPKIRKGKISSLKFDERNINKGSAYGEGLLEKSLQEAGAGRSILIDKNNVIIAGNKTAEKAGQIGMDDILIIETTGDQIVAVKRTDLDINSPEGAKMKILDNTVSKHNYVEDAEISEAICEEFELKPAELGLSLPEKPPGDDELTGDAKNNPPIMKITFKSIDQMIEAEEVISEILKEQFPGSFFSLSAGAI